MSHDFLSQLDWRFATKSYDTSKSVSEENIEKILTSIRMTPSSYGLQPYHIYAVKDPAMKIQLRTAGYNQPQFEEASHILVFCARTDVAERIENYIHISAGGDEAKAGDPARYQAVLEKMSGYTNMMKGDLLGRDADAQLLWAAKQTYIALGFALGACAELGIDSTPMEGFVPAKFDTILNLPSHMKSVVCLAVGYRKGEPEYAKVRFGNEDLFTKI